MREAVTIILLVFLWTVYAQPEETGARFNQFWSALTAQRDKP